MKRRLLSLLAALALLSGFGIVTSTPVGATNYVGADDPQCPSWENETYVGSRNASGSDGRNTVYVYIDVRESWVWTHYGEIHCYDYFAFTAASPSQSVNNAPLRLRVWVCGTINFNVALNGWNDTIISGAKVYANGCGPQADDGGTAVGTYGGLYYAHPYVNW